MAEFGPRGRLGPQGFLGVRPRRFRERVKADVVISVSFTPPVQIAIGNLTALGKPRGFLGFPARRFRERTLPFETTTRIVQVGLEPWVVDTPELQVYQVGLEAWTAAPGKISFERRARLGPAGILGIRPRRFRERSGEIGFVPAALATDLQIFQAGIEVWTRGEGSISFSPQTPIGPKGFLGIPPRKFREQTEGIGFVIPPPVTELQIFQAGIEVWTRGEGSISFSPQTPIGPKGFLGIPPRKFREQTEGV